MAQFKKSAKVQWKWLGRTINGTVEDIFTAKVTKTIKGKAITRNGTPDKPAYLVQSESGNLALKLETELVTASGGKKSAVKPKMFK